MHLVRPSCARRAADLGVGGGPRWTTSSAYGFSTAPFWCAGVCGAVAVHPVAHNRDAGGLQLRFDAHFRSRRQSRYKKSRHAHGWSGGTWAPSRVTSRTASRQPELHPHGPALGTQLAWREDERTIFGHRDDGASPAGPQRPAANPHGDQSLAKPLWPPVDGALARCVEQGGVQWWGVLELELVTPVTSTLGSGSGGMSTAGQGCACPQCCDSF